MVLLARSDTARMSDPLSGLNLPASLVCEDRNEPGGCGGGWVGCSQSERSVVTAWGRTARWRGPGTSAARSAVMIWRATPVRRRLWLRAWLRSRSKALSMLRSPRWARTPLACSMITRLFQCGLQLLVEHLAGQDPDRRDVGQRLGKARSTSGSGPGCRWTGSARRSPPPMPQLQRMGRAVGTVVPHRGNEPRPACRVLGEVGDADRCATAEALHARAFVRLQLRQLHPRGLLVGEGHDPQVGLGVDQEDFRLSRRPAARRCGQPAGRADR